MVHGSADKNDYCRVLSPKIAGCIFVLKQVYLPFEIRYSTQYCNHEKNSTRLNDIIVDSIAYVQYWRLRVK